MQFDLKIMVQDLRFRITLFSILMMILVSSGPPALAQQKWSDSRIEKLKKEVAQGVQEQEKLAQIMVDKVFSFAELGFQEFHTSKYLTEVLKKNGFSVSYGISGVPTAWVATWGSGKPVIALGSDIDCIPKASQKPGVAYHDPIIKDAPGHGEGHNSGVPLNILAAIEVKEIMEREGIAGTLMLWPGVAEELLATKAYYVRDGFFDDVDICIFTHVSNNFQVEYGQPNGTGLISVEYTFEGESAHSAGAPWRGRSALDAVELTSIAWQYQREHLEPLQRSHHTISNGGDQPNVVPPKASVWFFIRDVTYPGIMSNYERLNEIAGAAAVMTRTTVSRKVLGTAWPRHFNKVVAETMYTNIKAVGLPKWSDDDQRLAKALQAEIGSQKRGGLATEILPLAASTTEYRSGGSDDIGDVSWKVPTVTFRYPANIPGLPGHNWADAVAMATPIAHKGVVAGAKVEAMSIIDFLLKPALVKQAWAYYNDVQVPLQQYKSMLTADDKPAIYLNEDKMGQYRTQIESFHYDETRYASYLEQLGIEYPTLSRPKK
jgi:aminobenzoyl-glutamate utilization protein B